ncbi:MAG: hypothetical protein A3C90_04020 [Candidatus Magasanikbacteria bacterium RIFCSPHIGHO2_02_FULL_51_14]|uniref:Peptidoglycan binding-like domain-containing protein n=1 Tax=Candidatus Magasanikbacteria bacterium RIFCSPHIGHO2_02_FULL_51_14 TaxID=1798683 RepID=A0A1F6MDH7_9BACT|nr:MAG: hypothetical protein A3C90_04020 [Candidatus Magasanikbacteria bacterium RIFCSPHIGHO2_02_FULL_51_14]
MAMQQFQVAEGIVQRSGSESGIFGPKTRARVNEILISSETTSDIGCPPVAPTAVFQFTRTLPPGARSEDVRQLQQFLNLHGFPLAATGPGSFGHETVVYGFLTLDAVQRFQIEEHIVATPADPGHGLFGPRTRARANALLRGEK